MHLSLNFISIPFRPLISGKYFLAQANGMRRHFHVFIFGDSDERKDLFERSFVFLGKYLKP